MNQQRPQKPTKTKETVKVHDEDYLALLNAAKTHEASNTEVTDDANRVPIIKILQDSKAPELNLSNDAFIKGAKAEDFVASSIKTTFGKNPQVTVVGIFKMYEDKISEEADAKGKPPKWKVVGYWMPDQAKQLPMVKGSFFDRCYLDANDKIHKVSPVFWVYCYMKGHEDLGLQMFIFRATANENVKKLQKILSGLGGFMPQHLLQLTPEIKEFPDYNSSVFRPLFEETGKVNFEVDKNGKLSFKEMSKDVASEIIKTYHKLQSDYAEGKLIAKREISEAVAALPAPDETLAF